MNQLLKTTIALVCVASMGLLVACGGGGESGKAGAPAGKTIEDHRTEAKKEITEANAEAELKKLEAELDSPDPVIE